MTKKTIVFNAALQDKNFQLALQKHTIKLVVPASGTNPANIEALRTLTQFNIQIPENIMEQAIAYHANTDQARFKILKAALFDKSKKTVVWTLRGGYGSARLIDKLMKLPIPKQEKYFIGFSDITALHLFISQHWGWQTIHGAGLGQLVMQNDPKNLIKITELIEQRVATAQITDLKPLNRQAQKVKKISGKLTGGNLSIVETSLGTPWQIKTHGKIIFLEDTGEKGYRIDRSLHHLKQAGIFNKAMAIIFGEFTDPKDEHVEQALKRFSLETNIPIFKSNQFGHGKMNYPLVYNAKSTLTPSASKAGTEAGIFTLTLHVKLK